MRQSVVIGGVFRSGVDVESVLTGLRRFHLHREDVVVDAEVDELLQHRVLDAVHAQLAQEVQLARQLELHLQVVVDAHDARDVCHRLEAEMALALARTPLARRAVGQWVHLSDHLLTDDLELAGALQSERHHRRVRVVADLVRLVDAIGEHLEEVGARRRHVHAEQRLALDERVEDEALELRAAELRVVAPLAVGEADLVVEDEVLGVLRRHVHLHLRTALVVGVQHGAHLPVELEAVVEEDGANERHLLELGERDGLLQQLFVLVGRPELADELVRVGEEVVLVVLVADLVLLLRLHQLLLRVLVQHQMSATDRKQFMFRPLPEKRFSCSVCQKQNFKFVLCL